MPDRMKCLGASLLIAVLCLAAPAHAVDGASLELGGGQGTDVFRVGAQWNWQKKWFADRSWQLGGYWEASVGSWNNPAGTITDLGITPVFRLSQGDAGPYLEAAIGFHYLSGYPRRGNSVFSTKFQFGDHIGVGARFGAANRHDLGLRLQHVSNGGIKNPNPGINLLLLRYQYSLN